MNKDFAHLALAMMDSIESWFCLYCKTQGRCLFGLEGTQQFAQCTTWTFWRGGTTNAIELAFKGLQRRKDHFVACCQH